MTSGPQLTATVQSLVAEMIEGRSFEARLVIQLGETRIGISSNSTVLIDQLARYFRLFLVEDGEQHIEISAVQRPPFAPSLPLQTKEPDPGKTHIKEEYCDLPGGRLIRKCLTGMVFLMAGELNLAVGRCVANSNQVVNFVNSRYIEHLLLRGGLLCHASAAGMGSRSIVFAGRPGAGKSTVALRLLDEGFYFVSNDRLVLCREQGRTRVRGVPKLPRVNPGTILGQPRLHGLMEASDLARARSLSTPELWQIERKYDVPLDDLYGSESFRLEADLTAVVILDWTLDGGRCTIENIDPVERSDLLGPLGKSPGLFIMSRDLRGRVGSPPLQLNEYAWCIAGHPVLYVSGGIDLGAVVRVCSELIDRG